ncbi:uncharacterized protein V6R79_005163 [Siganus canaliculatus]
MTAGLYGPDSRRKEISHLSHCGAPVGEGGIIWEWIWNTDEICSFFLGTEEKDEKEEAHSVTVGECDRGQSITNQSLKVLVLPLEDVLHYGQSFYVATEEKSRLPSFHPSSASARVTSCWSTTVGFLSTTSCFHYTNHSRIRQEPTGSHHTHTPDRYELKHLRNTVDAVTLTTFCMIQRNDPAKTVLMDPQVTCCSSEGRGVPPPTVFICFNGEASDQFRLQRTSVFIIEHSIDKSWPFFRKAFAPQFDVAFVEFTLRRGEY